MEDVAVTRAQMLSTHAEMFAHKNPLPVCMLSRCQHCTHVLQNLYLKAEANAALTPALMVHFTCRQQQSWELR